MFEFMSPKFLIRHPQLIKKLAVKDFDYFTDHRVVINEEVDALFGKALISLQGQKWKGASKYFNWSNRIFFFFISFP